MKDKFIVKLDCRWFRGDVPCSPGALCEGCSRYESMGKRILIIKLGAIGDVLRTTPALPVIREKLGPCHVTWIVDADSAPLLKNSYIDRLVTYGPEALIRVMAQRFDVVYSLDKNPGAAGLATLASAEKKVGFVIDQATGAISYLGDSAAYAYRLGLDDDLKFRGNEQTYQQMIFEMMGLEWRRQKYILEIPHDIGGLGESIVEEMDFKGKGPVIGLVAGAGPVWPMKRWTVEGFSGLADMLYDELDARVMLLGAERDRIRNYEIQTSSRIEHPLAPHDMSIMEFAGLIGACDAIVTGDTAAMHLGLALEIPTAAIFGPTSAREVEMYGSGRAITPAVDCAPCYRASCDRNPNCMESISVEEVFEVVTQMLKEAGGGQ